MTCDDLGSPQDVDECDYFSFNREREICLLFATCETTSLDDPTFISGQRQCQYPQPSKFFLHFVTADTLNGFQVMSW